MKIQSVTLGAVAPVVVHTAGGSLKRVHGLYRGAAGAFLQIFDRKTAPTAALAPTFPAIPVYTDVQFDKLWYDNMEAKLTNGFVFAVSSTAATYTAYAGAIDLNVDGESMFDNTGLSTSGDYTTGVAELDLTGTTNLRLHRLEFTALSAAGASRYAKLFLGSSFQVGDYPVVQIELEDNTSKDCFFAGRDFRELFVVIDETPGAFATGTATEFAIKATYKGD
jgi:hypothetical protein